MMPARAPHIFAIRDRNQSALKRQSAVENTIERLEVFGCKVLLAQEQGIALSTASVRADATEIVNAVMGLTREVPS